MERQPSNCTKKFIVHISSIFLKTSILVYILWLKLLKKCILLRVQRDGFAGKVSSVWGPEFGSPPLCLVYNPSVRAGGCGTTELWPASLANRWTPSSVNTLSQRVRWTTIREDSWRQLLPFIYVLRIHVSSCIHFLSMHTYKTFLLFSSKGFIVLACKVSWE